MTALVCPDCRARGDISAIASELRCPTCGRVFERREGVVLLSRPSWKDSSEMHVARPLGHLDSTFARLSFYQLLGVMDKLSAKENRSVLIVGCGTGREFGLVSPRCKSISAIDISYRALVLAAKEHARLGLLGDVVLFDGSQIPYGERTFDIVLAHHVLHHIQDPMPFLNEMWRVCARRVIVCEPALTPFRSAVLALGLRPRVEEDGMRVHDFRISSLQSFAAAHQADFSYSLHFYPKPLGLTAQGWHRRIDRMALSSITIKTLRLVNRVAGPIIGTKVTASFGRRQQTNVRSVEKAVHGYTEPNALD